ncbi:sugar transferase [Clostridium perfringens]|uniref:sugar transferase n=1 Tax=Clostridium perfringens TaxID=1502 RepID=UPI001C861857|nr:sugar transferase [Clostridium perfringens]MDK0562930.1 sugar transferase [Clostridium perfringens]MDK0661906.1 sugar transferase [Clostridium perfringens]MDK0694948.1 sugar transferase [Clostridium perfringens]MDM0519116.1 sugar transferase [Clostridium perfringens]MDM0662783.1 sugar transferase [Clostridium perfringens]
MYKKYFKRLIDIIIALIGLPFFAVIYIFVGTLIKLDDRGPIFYVDRRIGKNSKIINMYKFRSMKVNAPDIRNIDGSTFNSKNDPRLTRLGRFLRETSIDEVPQLLNVLKGDMSIIGPRASMESALETYKDDEKDKMLVKPGISGYTQAYYRNGLTVREKRIKDAWYANNVSFILDIRIFFKTISTVFKKENLYTNSDI